MEVACLGCCSLSPVMMVDDNTHGKLTPEKVTELLQKYK
jgi:NADH:ubiquinone oxidoreductase subunit E